MLNAFLSFLFLTPHADLGLTACNKSTRILGEYCSHKCDERHNRLKPSSELQQEIRSDSSLITGRDHG